MMTGATGKGPGETVCRQFRSAFIAAVVRFGSGAGRAELLGRRPFSVVADRGDVRTVTSCVGVLWVAWQVELDPLPTATDRVTAEAHEHMRRPGRPWRVRHVHGPGEKFSPSFETHLGFGLYRHHEGEATDTTVNRTTAVSVPWGALAGAAAVFPAFRFRERLKRRRGFKRAARGQCVRCGYDVRASRESGRCPECGEALVSQ